MAPFDWEHATFCGHVDIVIHKDKPVERPCRLLAVTLVPGKGERCYYHERRS